ncbi:HAMP domain-containing histidine kinase [Alysiella crassa]|uniref:histidine kinase n=1 Tax=Alysiella crassa TaxID=153491 RepID=A0A376BVC7_9NEIS|nr:HAMP domain-containing histidine kinase [Alysiella crassa]UOP06289.1 HAMP domain-containing histidine kinase [Alysiella crassa]SSY80791.1 Alginate biosynthesis sensor protein kinB [Alysiella crassa]
MQRFLLIAGTFSCIALYLLTISTSSTSALSSYFWLISGVCAVLILAMFGVIIRYILLIIRGKHDRVFGSQIARRLSLMFTLVTVLPALFLLLVSVQFISHNIKTWFGNDTKEALERSLQLSKSAVDVAVQRSSTEAEQIGADVRVLLAQRSNVKLIFDGKKGQAFSHLALWDMETMRPLSERNPYQLSTPELDNQMLAELGSRGYLRSAENLNSVLYASGWWLLPSDGGEKYALFFRQPIAEQVAKDAELIESARSKYAELVFAQKGLQTFFIITLILAALLAILLALVTALYFAQRFVEPILSLATGARAVAQGDFTKRIAVARRDELGRLTELFNHMTEELAIAKTADEVHRAEQEAARHYLEIVLESLSSGVITLDGSGCLKTFNKRAASILDLSLKELVGKTPHNWAGYSPQHTILADGLLALLASERMDKAVEIAYAGRDETRILLGKAVRLPEENGNGVVLVFDNITTLVMAQKEAAWGEVAKRLAHEIRNPLTPIQLSAERLAWKLQGKLNETDEQILIKSTDTIVKQVAALKEMVEAFRNYARAPSLKMTELNLNELTEEVLLLYENHSCAFTYELSNIPLLLKADTTALRQVLHNLFKNAAEAAATETQPTVHVRTQQIGNQITLTVQNNGKSFSKHMLQNAFEPYITDKPSGTGLGLPVVKKIIEEHNGSIHIANCEPSGAIVTLEFNTEANNHHA